jgi:hypothetical protein
MGFESVAFPMQQTIGLSSRIIRAALFLFISLSGGG